MEELVLDPKEELFCQYVASGMAHGAAYRKAGLTKSNNSDSCSRMASRKMSENVYLSERIDKLKAQLCETIKAKHGKTREEINDRLDEIIDGLVEVRGELPGWNEVFKAINLKAEINGWKSSTTEVKGGMKIRVRVVDE